MPEDGAHQRVANISFSATRGNTRNYVLCKYASRTKSMLANNTVTGSGKIITNNRTPFTFADNVLIFSLGNLERYTLM